MEAALKDDGIIPLAIFLFIASIGAFVATFAQIYWYLSLDGSSFNNGALSIPDAIYFTVGILSTAGTGQIYPNSSTEAEGFVLQDDEHGHSSQIIRAIVICTSFATQFARIKRALGT